MKTAEQATLLNLDTKEITPDWVDPKQPLLVPVNPLHYTAHKYQIILARLDLQAKNNPAQFNSGNYILIMEKLEKLLEQINKGVTTVEAPDKSGVAKNGDEGAAPEVGEGATISVAPGISADNPLSG